MVCRGRFSVQLIEAADKFEPFKEHQHTDGNVYAEVKPDIEYLIAVRILKSKENFDDNQEVCVECLVDGKSLGISSFVCPKDGED